MIIQFIADVEGRVVCSDTTTFPMGDFTVNLKFSDDASGDEENRLDSISVERELTEGESNRFKNRLEPEREGRYRWELEGYDELHSEALNKLQTLESFFGLHGVTRIQWNSARTEFIPQNEEEERQLVMEGYEISQSYPSPPHEWYFDFSEYDWEEIERLKVPLAFYRRGQNRFAKFDYISAFIEYYFVIEGLFAQGDWQKVEDQYIGSEELISCAEASLEDLQPEKRDELEEFLSSMAKSRLLKGTSV